MGLVVFSLFAIPAACLVIFAGYRAIMDFRFEAQQQADVVSQTVAAVRDRKPTPSHSSGRSAHGPEAAPARFTHGELVFMTVEGNGSKIWRVIGETTESRRGRRIVVESVDGSDIPWRMTHFDGAQLSRLRPAAAFGDRVQLERVAAPQTAQSHGVDIVGSRRKRMVIGSTAAVFFIAGCIVGGSADWSFGRPSSPEDARAGCVLRHSNRLPRASGSNDLGMRWLIGECFRNPDLRAP
ncbi:hypothetical protein ACQW02_27850 [Humitalea sp. 24SJ18S-53]|uniref:hypothetical protein n=1 Tax=Humitalea sp. 24SJ18S-53 TaxID=3422307 RepID=UPI003D66DAC1